MSLLTGPLNQSIGLKRYEYTLLMPYSILFQCSLCMRTIVVTEPIPPNPYSMTDADPTSRSYEE